MKVIIWIFISISFAMADSGGIQHLQKIMSSLGSAKLTQNTNSGETEQGTLHWNGPQKCIRVEMNNGTIYLYTEGGMHIKEPNKDWTYAPLPNDWSTMLINPTHVVEEKKAKVHTFKDKRENAYALHLEEGGRFIDVFWTKKQLKGWVIGSLEQGHPNNEISVDLEQIPTVTLPNYSWKPESSFLESR